MTRTRALSLLLVCSVALADATSASGPGDAELLPRLLNPKPPQPKLEQKPPINLLQHIKLQKHFKNSNIKIDANPKPTKIY